MNVVETITVHPIMMDVPGDTDPRWKRKPPPAKREFRRPIPPPAGHKPL